MDWIKKNYAQVILAVVALVLLAMSVVLILNAGSFEDTFASIRGQVAHNNKIVPLDIRSIELAQEALKKPAAWTTKQGTSFLFVSKKYLVMNGSLRNPTADSEPLYPPVPNKWFVQNDLDFLDQNVLTEDPDGDGFNNLEEWTGMDPSRPGVQSTNPKDKNSHPPYLLKLRLVKIIRVPFRVRFNAYDGDPAKPDSLTFQINTLDVRQPTQFVKMNEQIAGTKFKVVKFEKKETVDANQIQHDISELTAQNIETGDQVVMVLEKTVDSPDSYALFKFLLDNSEIPVKKDKIFSLKPEPDVQYKVDIEGNEALIENLKKPGEKIKVPHLQ